MLRGVMRRVRSMKSTALLGGLNSYLSLPNNSLRLGGQGSFGCWYLDPGYESKHRAHH
jgi:hypothetical protein